MLFSIHVFLTCLSSKNLSSWEIRSCHHHCDENKDNGEENQGLLVSKRNPRFEMNLCARLCDSAFAGIYIILVNSAMKTKAISPHHFSFKCVDFSQRSTSLGEGENLQFGSKRLIQKRLNGIGFRGSSPNQIIPSINSLRTQLNNIKSEVTKLMDSGVKRSPIKNLEPKQTAQQTLKLIFNPEAISSSPNSKTNSTSGQTESENSTQSLLGFRKLKVQLKNSLEREHHLISQKKELLHKIHCLQTQSKSLKSQLEVLQLHLAKAEKKIEQLTKGGQGEKIATEGENESIITLTEAQNLKLVSQLERLKYEREKEHISYQKKISKLHDKFHHYITDMKDKMGQELQNQELNLISGILDQHNLQSSSEKLLSEIYKLKNELKFKEKTISTLIADVQKYEGREGVITMLEEKNKEREFVIESLNEIIMKNEARSLCFKYRPQEITFCD